MGFLRNEVRVYRGGRKDQLEHKRDELESISRRTDKQEAQLNKVIGQIGRLNTREQIARENAVTKASKPVVDNSSRTYNISKTNGVKADGLVVNAGTQKDKPVEKPKRKLFSKTKK